MSIQGALTLIAFGLIVGILIGYARACADMRRER
jgi:hypothetical protein